VITKIEGSSTRLTFVNPIGVRPSRNPRFVLSADSPPTQLGKRRLNG
jgi:hypothetical protein